MKVIIDIDVVKGLLDAFTLESIAGSLSAALEYYDARHTNLPATPSTPVGRALMADDADA